MNIGLIGRKVGMTRVFDENGQHHPVTVIEVKPNRVTQVKTEITDGYNAVQLTTGERRASRVTKAMVGHFAKANTPAGRTVREFSISEEEAQKITLGAEISVDIFQVGQVVDVTSELSKGKGYQGGVKRHNFRTQDASHGNSRSHRVPGSTGQNQTPGRVFKGKRMPGHLGAVRRTVQSLRVLRVDLDRSLLLVQGGVPGASGHDVLVKPAAKSKNAIAAG